MSTIILALAMGCPPVNKSTRLLRRVYLNALARAFNLVTVGLLASSIFAPASPLQIAGNLAFLPDSAGHLQVFNLGAGTNSTLVATSTDWNNISGIALQGQYAFVSVTNEGVFVFDVSVVPPKLVPGGRFSSIGAAMDVKAAGTTAFLADGTYGIMVIDLFEAANPLKLPTLFPGGIIHSLDIVSNRLYTACGPGGLLISDITSVSGVFSLGSRNTASPALRVRVAGNHAYVLCEGGRLEIINIQNPANPTLTATYLTTGELTDVDVKDNVAVLANTNSVLTVLNVSNPAAPAVQSTFNIAGGAWAVRLNGTNAYVRNGASGLVVVPLAALTASAPQLQEGVLAKVVAAGQPAVLSVLVSGTTPMTYRWSRNGVPLAEAQRLSGTTNAFLVLSNSVLADSGEFSVTVSNALGQLVSSNTLTVVNSGAPVWLGAFDPGGTTESLDVNNFIVHVAAGTNGLEIYDALDPRHPKRKGGNYVDGFAAGMRVSEGYAYVMTITNGFQVFYTPGSTVSKFIAATNTPGSCRAAYLAAGLAYVADGESGLEIFHLSGSPQPTFLGGYDTPGYAWNVFVANGLAYVADGTNGVHILSVTNPAAVTWLGTYDTPGEARNVKVFAGKAYVADGPGGLLVLNVSNPASPTLLGSHPSGTPALDLDLGVNTVVLARGTNGVESVNVANPAAMISLGTHPVTPANSLRLEGKYVYVATGSNGVQILELLGLTVSFPELTLLPGEVLKLPGESVTFQALATGPAPLAYQWYKDGLPLFDGATTFGADTATLTRSNLVLADSGEYAVVVRDGWNLPGIAYANLTVVPVGTPIFRAGYFNQNDSLNVHVVGQVAFVACRLAGLQAIDCRDPLNPVLIGQHPTLGLAQDVRVKGRYAYVASWDAGLEIFDVINPTNLVRVGQCPTPGLARTVRVAGNYAHVATRGGGISIVDIRNPAQPAVVGTAATSGLAEGLAVTGPHVYVAASQAGLEIFNTADPLAPVRIAQYDTPGNAESISLSGGHAYISDNHYGVNIVDVNNPQLPTPRGQFQTAGDAFQVQVVSNLIYIAEGIGKIEVASVSNFGPTTHHTTSLAGDSVRGMQIIGQHAFLADREAGFVVAELLGLPPSAPGIIEFSPSVTNIVGRELVLSVAGEGTPPLSYTWFQNGAPLTNSATGLGGNVPHLRIPSLATTNAGNYSVVIANAQGSVTSSVATVTVTPYGTPIVRNLDPLPAPASASVILGNIAYLADNSGGVQILDLGDLENLVNLGSYAAPGPVFGACLHSNLLYLALGSEGVAILNVGNPTQPVFVGAFDTPGTAYNLAVTNGRAFVADGEAGLRIFNVANPAAATALGFLAANDITRDVCVAGNFAYVADGSGGLRVITITNPASPVVIGSHTSAGQAHAVRLAGTRAYVANGTAGLLILDVQNPGLPVELGSYPTANATALDVVGNLILLADEQAGCLVLDGTNPAQVTLLGSAFSGPAPRRPIIMGNLAFISSETGELQLVELSGVPPLAPAFVTQPASSSVLFGGVAQFQATPIGTPPLTYRWYHKDLPVFDDSRITGSATTTLTVSNVTFADAGNYQLRVLGPTGVTNSAAAQLTFIGPLQAQLNAAPTGAFIPLAPGTYTETLVLDRDLTLTGPWWDRPVLSGGNGGPALRVLPGVTVTLRGIALRHGNNAGAGGGIVNEGTLILDRCLIADNAAASGGGIANLQTLQVFQSVISNNVALAAGGGLYNGPGATAFITNSTIAANGAEQGAGLYNLGTNTITGSLLADNVAQGFDGNGGGVGQVTGQMLLLNCTLSGNSAIALTNHVGAGLGGGAWAEGGRLDFQFTTVANNSASFRGGGVLAGPESEVYARNSIFADNTAAISWDFRGIMNSAGHNLVQRTAGLSISGTTTGNQLKVAARLGPLLDNGGPTLTHAPAADSPVIDAGAAPGPATDARGIVRPFDIPWLANAATGWDLGALEYVDQSPYLIMSNRTATGFTLAWASNAVLQKAFTLNGAWTDQTNSSPLLVSTLANQQSFFRLRAPLFSALLTTNNESTNGFDLSWPNFGILESAPSPDGPWESRSGLSPAQVIIDQDQNEFFRLRVIEH
jgi:hypothetical protein